MNIVLDFLAPHLFRSMRIRWGLVWTVVLFNMQHPFTLSGLLSKPMNAVSVLGNGVKLECSTKSHTLLYPVDWEFASAGSTVFSYIYASKRITESLSSRYKIDTDNRTRYDIVIDSVDLSYAGTYRCSPLSEEFKTASAKLTVLATDPVCETNTSALNGSVMEGDYILMRCTVNYTGDWIPVMEWSRSNGQIVDDNIIHTNTSTTVTSSLTVQLYSTDNGATFTCKTSFKQTSTKICMARRPSEVLAANVPHYQHLWNFKVNVLYAPRNLTIIPEKNVYEFGDRLMCWADSNPPPTYEWMETETNKTIPGSVLTTDEHIGSHKNQSFRCTAYFVDLTKQTNKTVAFTVTIAGSHQIATEQYIIISIIVVGAVCCLVLALYLCNNRCPYKTGIARPEPDILQALQINPYVFAAERQRDQPAVGRRAAQATYPPAAEGGNNEQQLPLPVYAEAQRKETIADGAAGAIEYPTRQHASPVYTEVMKNRNGSKNSEKPRQIAEATANPNRSPKTLTGADGTQYMDVTSIRDLNARAPIRHPPMFSVVETYASIDHTVDAPPPLPPKRQ